MIGDGYPSVGGRFAGHRIDSIIGRGHTGVVFGAEHLDSRRRAALRVLRPDLAQTIGFPDRFLDEVRRVGALRHPNTPDLIDAGLNDDLLFESTELVEGWDLEYLVDRYGRLHPRRVAALVGQVAGVLDAAHAAGIVHGRLVPTGVLVVPSARPVLPERVVVTGFGLGSLPVPKEDRGVAYLAPEALEGWAPEARGDVYSLAALTHLCLTGRRPDGLPLPRDLPEELGPVLAAGLARDPAERPASCGAFVRGLSGALAAVAPYEPQPLDLPERPRPPQPAPVVPPEPERGPAEDEEPARLRPVHALALVAIVLVGFLGLRALDALLDDSSPEAGSFAPAQPDPGAPGALPGPGPSAPAPDVEFPPRRTTGITSLAGLLPDEVAGFIVLGSAADLFDCSAGITEEVVMSYERDREIVIIAACLYPDEAGAAADVRDTIVNFGADGMNVIERQDRLTGPGGASVGEAVYMATPDNDPRYAELTTWTNGRMSVVVWSQAAREAGVTAEVMAALDF